MVKIDVKVIIFECFSQEGVFSVLKSYGCNNINQVSGNNYFATKN